MTMQTQPSRAGRKADSGEEPTTNERLVGNIAFLILGEVVFSLLAVLSSVCGCRSVLPNRQIERLQLLSSQFFIRSIA